MQEIGFQFLGREDPLEKEMATPSSTLAWKIPWTEEPGNKCDLWEKRHVLFEDACILAEKYGLLAVLETSAKESKNIDEVFVLMARELMARHSLPLYGEGAPGSLPLESTPVLMAPAPREKNQCTC